MSESTPSLARDTTSIVSKSIGSRRGQRVTPTESIGPLLMAAAGLTSGLLAAASYWWLRQRP
jgi:hypothetical protein